MAIADHVFGLTHLYSSVAGIKSTMKREREAFRALAQVACVR